MAKVVGIDLGTTFSAIAELDDLGNPEVLSDPETGNRITRSAVFLAKIQYRWRKSKRCSCTNPKKLSLKSKEKWKMM